MSLYSPCSPAEHCLDTSDSLSLFYFGAEESKSLRKEHAAAAAVNRTELNNKILWLC